MAEHDEGSAAVPDSLLSGAGQEAWLAASVGIGQQVLDPSQGVRSVVQDILDHVLQLSRAQTVTFIGPSQVGDDEFEVRVAAGLGAESLLRRHYLKRDTLEGRAMQENCGLLATAPHSSSHHQHADAGQPVGPLLAVPFTSPGDEEGALVASRAADQPGFDDTELAMTEDFARHASVILQLTEAQATRDLLRHRERHDGQTRQLHDDLIQDLFSLGITLQSLDADSTISSTQRAVLHGATQQIDAAIARLRASLTTAAGPRS